VRVRGIDDPDVSLLLDNGAMGIVYPDINTAAEAKRAVDACKFAPIGKRSVSGSYTMFDFRAVSIARFRAIVIIQTIGLPRSGR